MEGQTTKENNMIRPEHSLHLCSNQQSPSMIAQFPFSPTLSLAPIALVSNCSQYGPSTSIDQRIMHRVFSLELRFLRLYHYRSPCTRVCTSARAQIEGMEALVTKERIATSSPYIPLTLARSNTFNSFCTPWFTLCRPSSNPSLHKPYSPQNCA